MSTIGRAMQQTAVEDQADRLKVRHSWEIQLSARVDLTVSGREGARVDSAAGAEFVDDRLRLDE